MHKLTVGVLFLTLCPWVAARPPKASTNPPPPHELVIGRHTYFDFGPPFDFYEVFSIQSGDGGLSVERLTLTPAGDPCLQPATVEVASATIGGSISDLLGRKNPCAIPERELRRELKRCRKCLVFSGADVTMQVMCGNQTRRIRMDILDRDMFDPAPRTPEHTSWTMALLRRLDQALGKGIMDRPAFFSEPAPAIAAHVASSHSKNLNALRLGTFDSLFDKVPHRLSDLYVQSQNRPVGPTIEMLESPTLRPISYALPKYPPLARLARVEGKVAFALNVTSEGTVSNLSFAAGHVMLQKAVESEVTKWKFPTEAAGRKMDFVIEFRTNCPSGRR
ncbi:MAG: energy transducer TonB [Bryobacteraceae bacterium]